MIALVVDAREREVYAHVRLASAGRFAITFETGVTIEADAHEGVQGLVVEDLSALQRAAAERVGATQPGAEHQQRGHEHQRNQKRAQQHGAKVAPRRAGRQSP